MGRSPQTLDTVAEPFAPNPHVIIAAPDHPLAGVRRVPVDRVARETFIVREPGSGTRLAMQQFFEERRLTFRVAMEMASNETIKQAVMAGHGRELHLAPHHRSGAANGTVGRSGCERHAGDPAVACRASGEERLSPTAAAFKRFVLAQGRYCCALRVRPRTSVRARAGAESANARTGGKAMRNSRAGWHGAAPAGLSSSCCSPSRRARSRPRIRLALEKRLGPIEATRGSEHGPSSSAIPRSPGRCTITSSISAPPTTPICRLYGSYRTRRSTTWSTTDIRSVHYPPAGSEDYLTVGTQRFELTQFIFIIRARSRCTEAFEMARAPHASFERWRGGRGVAIPIRRGAANGTVASLREHMPAMAGGSASPA